MAETFSRFDAADYLRDEADMAAYLEAAAEEGDPSVLATALGTVARARNMSQLSRDTGISREGLLKALGPKRQPDVGNRDEGCRGARAGNVVPAEGRLMPTLEVNVVAFDVVGGPSFAHRQAGETPQAATPSTAAA